MKYDLLLILFVLIGCSLPKREPEVAQRTDTVRSDLVPRKVSVADSDQSADKPWTMNAASVQILFTGTFHGDEVNEGAAQLSWLGLFSDGDDNYVLRKIRIITERVVDGLFDDEEKGEKTGWEVTTESGESPIMLISGGNLQEGAVNGATVPAALYPGDSAEFEFMGVSYLMYATGSADTDSTRGVVHVADYNLHMVRTDRGKSVESVLVHHGSFDEAMTSILWSGDLDGDNYIDLLIDLSNHYNVRAPTLFLSRGAMENEAVTAIADHVTVGC